MKQTKTEKAVEFWKSGNKKAALHIFKTFKIGFTKEDIRSLQITYEAMTGKEEFYKSIGVDVLEEEKKVEALVKRVYGV